MRRFGFMLLLISVFSIGTVAHADTYTRVISDRYGTYDPYYNGSPYIPVPAAVLYGGCRDSTCSEPSQSNQPYQTYQPQQYQQPQQYTYPAPYVQHNYSNPYDNGAEKGVTYVQPASNNYTNVYPTTYAVTYPGTPNTGAHDQGIFNLFILIASAFTAAGTGTYLLRSRRHA
ncbi:MAG: hypothetical protein JWL88_506 [Parcubacteria group bacterium]|nr:hypothetical protein [Parcubacteria group bacterium]